MCFWRCLAGVNVIIGERSGSEEDGQEGHDPGEVHLGVRRSVERKRG